MKNGLKYALAGLFAAIFAIIVIAVFLYGNSEGGQGVCKSLEVSVQDSSKLCFIRTEDIRKLLEAEYGQFIGQKLEEMDLSRIEEIVDGKSAVRKSQVYTTSDGTLHIKLSQQNPAIRFQTVSGGFYADKNGNVFPLQKNYSPHVMVVDGTLPLPYNCSNSSISDAQRQWIKDMIRLSEYIDATATWRRTIAQIHIMPNGDVALIPRQGNETFILGRVDSLDDKFERIGKYYSYIVPEKGADAYRTVSVKFDGQIVCRK